MPNLTGQVALVTGASLRVGRIVIISGDHEAPTQKLAQTLGVDDYFANTLRATLAWRENTALRVPLGESQSGGKISKSMSWS